MAIRVSKKQQVINAMMADVEKALEEFRETAFYKRQDVAITSLLENAFVHGFDAGGELESAFSGRTWNFPDEVSQALKGD
jgi:hypothetical protein